MDLIKRIYKGTNGNLEQKRANVLFDNISMMEQLMKFLNDGHYFDTDLYIPEVI